MTAQIETLQSIEKKLIQSSNVRMVICGEYVELYEYEKPYFYNWPPAIAGKVGATPLSQNSLQRRDDNLYRARRDIRRIIFSNERAWCSELKFFTFTFKKNVKKISKANREWAKYTKRLNRALHSRGFSSAKYLAVVEFQKRGAVHFHVLYFNLPHLSSYKINIAELWKQGFVHAKGLREVRVVGAYVCKYLQKGAIDKRLAGKKAFFTSRNLKKPIEVKRLSTVEHFLKDCIVERSYESVYQTSKYGFIRFRQLELKKIDEIKSNSTS